MSEAKWLAVGLFAATTMATLFALAWPFFQGEAYRRLDRVAYRMCVPLFACAIVAGCVAAYFSYQERAERFDEGRAHRHAYECHAIVYSGRIVK